MNKISLTLLIFGLICPLWAAERKKSFKPEEFNHKFAGCPMNSNCSKKAGAHYKSWVSTLKKTKDSKNQVSSLNRLASKKGLPFSQWVTSKGSFTEGLIVWDSHCRNHNVEGQSKIHIGMQFIKNISEAKELEKQSLTHNRFIHILESSGRITKRVAPRIDTPLYLDGDSLVYQMELEGHYFSQAIDKSGQLNVVKSITPKSFPQTVDCPKELLASVDSEKLPKNLFRGFFCQMTWERQTGRLKTILLPWSCN